MTEPVLTHLMLSELRESPTNPRTHFDESALDDLARSIREQGVLQPIIVRPLPEDQRDIELTHEICFGHRRFRAAALAGLADIPVIVRDLSDRDVAVAQLTENLQRADVLGLDEALAVGRLQADHGLSPREIAAAVGKSLSWTYNVLRLASASPAVHQAMRDQGLPRELAVEVARFAGDALQRRALDHLAAIAPDGESWPSFRAARAALPGLFSCRADGQAFSITDAELVAYAGACSSCPKRAGNDAALAELLDADVCTDALCYRDKVTATTEREKARLRSAGATVLDGEAAAAELTQHGYAMHHTDVGLLIDLVRATPGEALSLEDAAERLQAAGIEAPQVVHIELPTGGLGAFIPDAAWREVRHARDRARRAKAREAAGDTQTSAARDDGDGDGDAQSPDPHADWSPAERAALDEDVLAAARERVLPRIVASLRTAGDLRVLVRHEFAFGDYPSREMAEIMGLTAEIDAAREAAVEAWDGESDWWDAWVAEHASPDQLAALLVATAASCALQPAGWRRRENAQRAVAVAALYGVDLADVRGDAASETSGGDAAAGAGDLAERQGAEEVAHG